jgi:nitroreductase
MDAMETLLTRRSIRRYTSEAVPEDVIHAILEAAMSAPSANNEQAWQFIVITDRKVMQEAHKLHPYSDPLIEAAVAIVVCGDLSRVQSKGFWVQDCSAATENLLLAAHAKGLGAVWMGVYPDEARSGKLRQLFGTPDTIVPFSLIAIGHPAEHIPPAQRFDAQRVHTNRW